MTKEMELTPPTRSASNSRSNLYPDFVLTEDNCKSEPIHRPVAIQSQGHLLVFDVSKKPTLHAISSRLAQNLGHSTDDLWDMPIQRWLPSQLQEILDTSKSADFEPQCQPSSALLQEGAFQVTYHRRSNKIVIELEPEAHTQVEDQAIRNAAQLFRQLNSLETLYSEATGQIADSFGYERVMIYEFDQDQHGCIVGEHKAHHLEPFLGLHYPESDIPKMARDLFLLVKSRAISEVNADNDFLLFNPALGQTPPHLDLSLSQLRATSPIHIEYLQNMGVAATLTFAIIIQGKLWGLVACHHGSPRQVLFNHKLIGEAISELLAKRILELKVEARESSEVVARAIESSFLDRIKMSDNYRIQILQQASLIRNLCEADGAALITLDQCVYSSGHAPSNSTLIEIRDWLVSEGHDEIFNTVNFNQDIPISTFHEKPIGGMLSSCISSLSRSYLLWFRQPVSQVFKWAGDPTKSYTVEPSADGGDVRISPRQSFAKWQVSIEGQSLRWDQNALDMADRIRQGIFKKELRHSAMLVEQSNKEFMQLTYAAAHDLQEPLRTQSNYLELLKELVEDEGREDQILFINKTENAAFRMRDLVDDLLAYSQLGSTTKHESVNLSSLIKEICTELEFTIEKTSTELSVGELPIVAGDSKKLQQLLRNLITNAIKYVGPGIAPKVAIYTEHGEQFWTLNFKDNGIGIDQEHHRIIFDMFKRLHGKTEYEGSGIGLAICKKVASQMDAELGITSAPGAGSTFWIRFHNSTIIKNS